jgi:hypothetical protein
MLHELPFDHYEYPFWLFEPDLRMLLRGGQVNKKASSKEAQIISYARYITLLYFRLLP